jgi:hypothetical protein
MKYVVNQDQEWTGLSRKLEANELAPKLEARRLM